jgi:hypothetical protein
VGLQPEDFLPPGAPVVASGESAEFALDLGEQAITLHSRVSPLTDRRGTAIGQVIFCRDVTELTRANLRLREQLTVIEELQGTLSEQAVRDPLTGLHNRRHLMTELTADLLRCREARCPLSVVLIDLDHFKSINDRYGHATGDEVLRLAARRSPQALASRTPLPATAERNSSCCCPAPSRPLRPDEPRTGSVPAPPCRCRPRRIPPG